MAARKGSFQRIGWAAIFAKAYALVSQETPELRQTYISYPWARIYQHPSSIVSISVNRFDETIGCERLFWTRIRNVESLSLLDIQSAVEQYQHADVTTLFPDGRLLESLPSPLRTFFWHILMRWTGRKRARKLGTFSLSTLATYGTTNHAHPLVVTTSLSYGPLDNEACSTVTLQADHRVLDGAIAARALVSLEEKLQNEIVNELHTTSRSLVANKHRKSA